MRTWRALLVTAALAAFGLGAQTATAGESVSRPFTATVEHFSVSLAAEQRCGGDLTLALTLTGTATHLGRFSAAGTHCTEPTLTVAAVPVYDGLATFTAADGSTLTVMYEGSQDMPASGVAVVRVEVEVLSGSGRFVGAAGEWTGSGSIDFATFSGEAVLSGWLSY